MKRLSEVIRESIENARVTSLPGATDSYRTKCQKENDIIERIENIDLSGYELSSLTSDSFYSKDQIVESFEGGFEECIQKIVLPLIEQTERQELNIETTFTVDA